MMQYKTTHSVHRVCRIRLSQPKTVGARFVVTGAVVSCCRAAPHQQNVVRGAWAAIVVAAVVVGNAPGRRNIGTRGWAGKKAHVVVVLDQSRTKWRADA